MFLLFRNPYKLPPYLNHSKGVKLAVFKQIVSGYLLPFGFGENRHRLAAVMHPLQIVIV